MSLFSVKVRGKLMQSFSTKTNSLLRVSYYGCCGFWKLKYNIVNNLSFDNMKMLERAL